MRNRFLIAGIAALVLVLLIVVGAGPERTEGDSSESPGNEPSHESDKPGFNAYSTPPRATREDPYAVLDNGRTRLTQAAYDGDRAQLQRFLEGGANLSSEDANGDNTLVAAVAGGQLRLAEDLMERGVIVDREAFRRLALVPGDKDKVHWLVYHDLPVADPQKLSAFFDLSDEDDIKTILAAGYRPTREEAVTVLEKYLNNDAYYPLYQLYPDLFTEVDKDRVINPINYATATPKERVLLEAIFPTIPYSDSRAFQRYLDRLPYDVVVTHPDYAKFGMEYFDDYCDTDDESVVPLLDEGVRCSSKYPFGEAVTSKNYALVQRFIDTGTDPASYRMYDKSIFDLVLDYKSGDYVEMAKLLIDNGAATQEQEARFYQAIHDFGNRFDRYRTYAYLPLKLAASLEDDLYVLGYSNEEHRYYLTRQDASGSILWRHVFDGQRFFNVLDNPAGMYYDNGHLLLVQNRYLDGRRMTRVSLFGSDGEALQQRDVNGVFEAFVLTDEGYALTTARTTSYLDKRLELLGDITTHPEAFIPAVPLETTGEHSRHRYFHYDLQKQDFYPDRTLILFRPSTAYSSWAPPRPVSEFLALMVSKDGETSVTAPVGGNEVTPLDFAVSDSHAFIILTAPGEVVIQKRSADFEIGTYHYLDFDRSPFATTVGTMACDGSGCSILGEARGKLALIRTVPGDKTQALSITEFDYEIGSDEKSGNELYWQIVRNGETDFISGSLQVLFDKGQPKAKGDAILLDRVLGLATGRDGMLYAFGSHDGDAAYEALDGEAKLLGHHEFDFGYADSRINDMLVLPDGRLLVVGHMYQYYHFFKTFAAVLTPEGKPLWSRVYHDMQGIHGLLADSENGLFYTIDTGGSINKISLQDGSIVKHLPAIGGLTKLLRAGNGQIVAIGEKEQSYGSGKNETYDQPLVYCLAPDEATFSISLVGEPGDRIVAAAPWKNGLVAAYLMDKDGSIRSNAVLGRIDAETCQIILDWEP